MTNAYFDDISRAAAHLVAIDFGTRAAEYIRRFAADTDGHGDEAYEQERAASGRGQLMDDLNAIGVPLGAPELGDPGRLPGPS